MIENIMMKLQVLGPMDIVGPIIGGCIFIMLMSLVCEPARQQFNAIFVAGAGAAYFNGGLGCWEYAFTAAATIVAYRGLRDYRFIALAWMMHTFWDILHHINDTPIWPWLEKSSMGCAIFDPVIAIWFFYNAPNVFNAIRKMTIFRKS